MNVSTSRQIRLENQKPCRSVPYYFSHKAVITEPCKSEWLSPFLYFLVN